MRSKAVESNQVKLLAVGAVLLYPYSECYLDGILQKEKGK